MVNKRYVRGIVFVVLMLSVVLIGMAAAPTITFNEPPTPTNGATVNVDYVNISVTLSESGTALLKWDIDANVSMIGSGTSFYYNKTGLSDGTYSYIVYANDSTPENWTTSPTRTVTVSLPLSSGAPSLSYTPLSDPTSASGTGQTFNASSNQTVNFSWLINGTEVQYNASAISSDYSNNTAGIGVHNVTVNINNSNGTASHSWSWTVADGTPPASITNLQMQGNGTSWINWTWTNPTDGDFAKVMVYIDGIFKNNVSAPDSYYNATTGLISGTSYNISTHTVDTSFNVNSTWVNLTNSTLPNTQTGSQVNVTLQNSTVTFSSVTVAGNTTEAPNASKSLPSGYTAVGNYIDISTTATYTAPVTVRVKYTSLPSGYTASDVRLYHWNDSTNQWDNVTTSVNSGTSEVIGTVSSLSPFVPGVPSKPAIIKDSPAGINVQTVGSQPATFQAHSDQVANITWRIDTVLVFDNGSMASLAISTYTNSSTPAGSHNVTVTATNTTTGLSNTTYWNWTVRPKTYETGNRVWDANKEMNLTYTWNPMSFYAFYYDVDNNVGNESLKIILDSNTDRNIQENTLIYSTTPDNVSFKYKKWGFYNVTGFMAQKYFAAYTAGSTGITSTPISMIGSKQLHKILMDDDTSRAVYAGSTLTLSEGYVLKVKDVDITGGKIVLLSLLKDGNEVDTTAISAGSTYVYSKKVGSVSDVPIIAVHIDTVFAGREANAAFLKGIFQISESFISVNTGNRYGIMEITAASDTGITMVNKNSISFSPASVNDVMGDIKIIVADNSSVLRFAPMVQKSGTYEVRGTISQSTDTTFDWNPLNFEGFYYDINEDVGSEKLSLTRTDRTIAEKALVYTTTPQSVSFKYKNFGSYNVIGFMAEKYFAGYTANSTGITGGTVFSTINSKQLHKVLADDNTQRAVYAGSTLTLSEGYVLKVKDVDITGGKIVLVSLLKDGNEVDTTAIQAGNTYIYSKKVGSVSDLPVIAAHVETVFVGKEANAAFMKGIFQISESYTSVNTGDQIGALKVSQVSDTKIEMNNPSTMSLSAAGTIDVMGKIKFKVADSGDVRFYPFIMVNGSIAAANQLSIDAPANPSVRDTITIIVTAGSGTPIEGASVSFDNNDIGTTNSTGKLNYTLTRSGLHNITATKLGYEKAVKTIQVSEYVDNRLSIEVPAIIDQGVPVSIKVISNGTAIPGASVTFDNSAIGTTDAKGILNYTFNVGGTHNLGASKDKYISVVREISIRMPFSEYKALDISIIPNVVFTNEQALIRSNITNVGTKADTRDVELIFNGTVVDNKSIALAPGEIKEINFTRKEALPGNYTVELLGQKGVLEVREEPLNLLLIGGIATGFGAIIIYLLTAKSKISLEMLRQKLLGKFGKKAAEKAVEVVTPPKQ